MRARGFRDFRAGVPKGTKMLKAITAVVAIASCVSPLSADVISLDLNSFANGTAVQGGAFTQTPGGGQWWLPDNAATSGYYRSGLGRTGGTALAVGNRGNGNDGVITNILTPRLANAAGSAVGGNTYTQFNAEYWVRTAPTSTSTSFRFRSEVWGGWGSGNEASMDRTSFFGMQAAGDGSLQAFTYGGNAAGDNLDYAQVAVGLTWGSWYRVTTSINYFDGVLNGGAFATVTTRIFGTDGAQLGESVQRTWGTIWSASQPQVDRLSFTSRGGFTGDNAYVDGITYSSSVIPAPGALAALGIAGLAGRRRRGA